MFETATDFFLTALLGVSLFIVRENRLQCRFLKSLVIIAKMKHPKEAEQVGL